MYLQQDNQLFQQPLNHVGWYPGYGQLAYWIDQLAFLRPDGGFWAMTGDPVANPVIQLDESPDRKQFDAGLCGVGFDLHLRWNPPYGSGVRSVVLQPGTYRVRWRLTSATAQTADTWAPSPATPTIASGGEGAPYPLVLRALGQYVTTGPLLREDRWHHLAISHDGSTLRLYVDGAVIREVSAAGRLLRAGGDATLRFGAGAQERELVYPFAGRLGAVRVAPRALSPAEVAAQVRLGPYQ